MLFRSKDVILEAQRHVAVGRPDEEADQIAVNIPPSFGSREVDGKCEGSAEFYFRWQIFLE